MDNFSQKSNIISSLFNVTQPPQPGTIRTILLPHPCSVRALPTEFRSGCWSMRCRSELNPNRKRSEAKIEAKKRVRRKRPGTLIAATSAQMEDVSSPKQGMAMANHWSLSLFSFHLKMTSTVMEGHALCNWFSWVFHRPEFVLFHQFINFQIRGLFLSFRMSFPFAPKITPWATSSVTWTSSPNSQFGILGVFFANEGLLAITMFFHVNGEIGY